MALMANTTKATRTPTRERILAVTLKLFAERGYAATTISDIEQAAGLSAGSGALYRHFSSKEELGMEVVQILRDRFSELRQAVPGILELNNAHRELKEIANLFTGLWLENQGAFALLGDAQVLPAEMRTELGKTVDDGCQWFVDWLSGHISDDSVDLETTAMLMAGSMSFYGQQFIGVGLAPLGIPQDRMYESWSSHWSEFVRKHR